MKWNRFVRTLGLLITASFVITVLTPAANVVARINTVRSDVKPADAIVVLGAGLWRDGSLNSESIRRFLYGLRLYSQGLAPLLVLSGPPRDNTAPEASVRGRIATELGIPSSAIIEMDRVSTTRDEADEVASILRQRSLNHILLVTGSLHMRRSKLSFESAGLRVSAAPSDNFPEVARGPEDRVILLVETVKHSIGLLYYRIAGFI
jgi:uncharacterized SAM-binding protein YcdF (DUF218 family)